MVWGTSHFWLITNNDTLKLGSQSKMRPWSSNNMWEWLRGHAKLSLIWRFRELRSPCTFLTLRTYTLQSLKWIPILGNQELIDIWKFYAGRDLWIKLYSPCRTQVYWIGLLVFLGCGLGLTGHNVELNQVHVLQWMFNWVNFHWYNCYSYKKYFL